MRSFRRRSLLGRVAALAMVCIAGPALSATLLTAPKEQSSGLLITLEYQPFGQGGQLSRQGGAYRTPVAGTVSQQAVLRFLSEAVRITATPVRMQGRIVWGNSEAFLLITRSDSGTQATVPLLVNCAPDCEVDTSVLGKLAPAELDLFSSTVDFIGRAPTQLGVNLTKAQLDQYPVKYAFSSAAIPGSAQRPITYRVPLVKYLAEAGGVRRSYDLSTWQWVGGKELNPELLGLADFLANTRAVGAKGDGTIVDHLNRSFGSDHAHRYAYLVNTFNLIGGQTHIENRLLPATEFVRQVGTWRAFVPLGYILHGTGRYVLFSTDTELKDLQMLGVDCQQVPCRPSEDLPFQFPADVLQQPALLAQYYANLLGGAQRR